MVGTSQVRTKVDMGRGAAIPGGVIVVDVGNTTTVVGVFEAASAPSADPSLRWELTTPGDLTSDEAFLSLGQLFGGWQASGAILSCVVPTHVAAWQAALARTGTARPFVVGPGFRTGLRMHYRDPAEIGPDRIADAVAMRERYQTPAVAIDFGTTMNIEVIDAQGAFVGGLIAPGLALGARALSKRTARLPVVEIEMPKEVIGRSTREAMLSGIVFGEVARIDGLLDRVFAEIASEATVVLTGDYAHEISKLISHEAVVDDTLTLRGLHQLYLLNATGSKRGS